MRCADLRHVHLERRVLPYEYARCAGMVEMNVAQKQVADVREREPVAGEPALQGIDGRRRPAVEDRRAVVGIEHIRPDRALMSLVVEVDRLHHAPRVTRSTSSQLYASLSRRTSTSERAD